MMGAHLAPVAAAIEEAECSDPECRQILRDTIAEMKGAEILFARLQVLRKGAKLIEPFNDMSAIDRLSDVAINEFGHDADDVQTALAHGFKDAHEGGSDPTKNGEQRGTSRREDVLDTSIVLRHPADYVTTEGARFEVHIVKGRGIRGEGAKPFEAILTTENGAQIWTMRDVEDAEMAKVRRMLDDGMSQRDIADDTGIPKSTIARWKLKFDAERAASA